MQARADLRPAVRLEDAVIRARRAVERDARARRLAAFFDLGLRGTRGEEPAAGNVERLGVASGFLGGALPTNQSQYLPSFLFAAVILVLLIRPRGLFARAGQQAVERV